MTQIKLHNTKTRRKEDFEPIDPRNVRMYLCGPTVYDRAHLGNARNVLMFDVLFRLMRFVYGKKSVTYVRNFTDVDDKINARAAESGREIGDITAETIGWYHDDMDALGALRPTHEPRATAYIAQMITMTEDLIAKAGGLEERLYRHRCVEAWAMAVPWSGVPLANLVKLANPKPEAKYLQMETFLDPSIAPGQKQSWYPWPYVEGLTLAEATNELAFLATGIYGKPMPAQNGAPIRLVTPWKYGFKSVKSITRFTFTDKQPVSFWEQLNGNEYGFWANVNPDVPHPRWSQKTERLLGSNKNVRTQLYNGYGEQVAGLYDGMFPNDDRKLFH